MQREMSVGNAVSVMTAVEVGDAIGAVEDRIGVAVGTCGELGAGVAQAPNATAVTSANKGSLIDRTTPPLAEVFCRSRLASANVGRAEALSEPSREDRGREEIAQRSRTM